MDTDLVGREVELDRLADLVAHRPVVTVTGPPGVGKSHVARGLADRLAADDLPVLWCDTPCVGEAHASHDIGAALADQLGFGSVDALLATLDARRHLLVLDGCELPSAATGAFVERLVAERPDVRVLATSRRPLGADGEFVRVLPPLPVPAATDDAVGGLEQNPAVALYLARSSSAGATPPSRPDHLHLVARLVRELDGLPLGIELAAARARTLGPGDLLRRTDQQLDLLRAARGAGRGAGGAPPSSLRASLDLSYRELDPDAQALLRALSVFRGPVAGDIVHAVCAPDGADEIDTADLLATLVDASLVQADPGSGGLVRYRLLNVVRRFAADRLAAEGGPDEVEERCIDRLSDLADGFVAASREGWPEEQVARMLGCFPTLVGTIELAVRRDADGDRAFRLYLPLYSALQGSHAAEVAAVGSGLRQRWPDGSEPRRPEADAVTAAAHLVAGDAPAAQALAAEVLASAEASDLARLLAIRTSAFAAFHDGDEHRALALLDEGVALARGCGPPYERDLRIVRAAVVDGDHTVDELTDLAVAAAGTGDPMNQMSALVVLAHVLVRDGRRREAGAAAGEALALAERLDHAWGRAAAQRVLAVLDALDRGWAASTPRWEEALTIHLQAGDRGALAQTIEHAVRAAAAAGESEIADALADARLRGRAPTLLPAMLPPAAVPAAGAPAGSGTATATGTTSMAEAVRRVRAVLAGGSDEPAAPSGPALVRSGEVWTATFAGRSTTVRHAKGLDDLATLLASPGTEVNCLDLMGAAVVEPDTGGTLDRTARAHYEQRIRELQAELDEATANHDAGREEIVSAELDALVDQLASATARGGRDRSANATVERARAAVRWRLRAAIERLGGNHAPLGRHLDASIRTGVWCSYQPEQPTAWQVDRASEG